MNTPQIFLFPPKFLLARLWFPLLELNILNTNIRLFRFWSIYWASPERSYDLIILYLKHSIIRMIIYILQLQNHTYSRSIFKFFFLDRTKLLSLGYPLSKLRRISFCRNCLKLRSVIAKFKFRRGIRKWVRKVNSLYFRILSYYEINYLGLFSVNFILC